MEGNMTGEKILEVVGRYRKYFENNRIPKKRVEGHVFVGNEQALAIATTC